jgi:hypothetical protein
MASSAQERTLANIVRLRRAETRAQTPEVAEVREDLEEQLGQTVPRSAAARLLGVSHTALNRWIDSGDVPVVITRTGRKEVPIPPLLELHEQVVEQRRRSPRRLHALESLMLEARRRAEGIPSATLATGGRSPSEPHRTPELRSLAYHQAIAPRLRRPQIEEARRKLVRRRDQGRVDPRHAEAWGEVFALPMSKLREAITADDERGRDLRQSSPLAGMLSEQERRKALALG